MSFQQLSSQCAGLRIGCLSGWRCLWAARTRIIGCSAAEIFSISPLADDSANARPRAPRTTARSRTPAAHGSIQPAPLIQAREQSNRIGSKPTPLSSQLLQTPRNLMCSPKPMKRHRLAASVYKRTVRRMSTLGSGSNRIILLSNLAGVN